MELSEECGAFIPDMLTVLNMFHALWSDNLNCRIFQVTFITYMKTECNI